jgi:hypothetical protein
MAAPVAVSVVEDHFGRRLIPTALTLAAPDGMAELTADVEQRYAPGATSRAASVRHHRRAATKLAGQTLPDPRRRAALIHLNTRSRVLRTVEGIAETVLHELVHVDQLGRPGIYEHVIEHHRRTLRDDLTPWQERTWRRMIADHENEAETLEAPLTRRLQDLLNDTGVGS